MIWNKNAQELHYIETNLSELSHFGSLGWYERGFWNQRVQCENTPV